MTRARDLADYISTGVSDTELDVLDGVTAGTVTASKALVVDANKDIASLRNITATGTITGTVSTAAQTNITSLGTLTALTVDDITINGSTISDGGDLTLDVAGDIILDADGGQIRLKDGGTETGFITMTGGDLGVKSTVNDKDIVFKGVDNNSEITALTLDMSDAGTATFNHDVKLGDNGKAIFGASSDLQIYHSTADAASIITDQGTGPLAIQSNLILLQNSGGTANLLKATEGGAVELLHSNATKLATTSSGVTVTGEIVASRLVDSGSSGYYVDPFGTSILAYAYLQQTYAANSALSGTTPTCDAATFSSFSLTTSGNTTFTFSTNVNTGFLHGFILKLTSGGSHTITYPNTVDFAGGAAPDAPASGETDILVFTSIDGGTNWYGARAIDAAA